MTLPVWASNGFSSFSSVYTSGDRLFYAVTDGVDYEVGSGTYHTGIVRHPLRSSNSDNKGFSAGIKKFTPHILLLMLY